MTYCQQQASIDCVFTLETFVINENDFGVCKSRVRSKKKKKKKNFYFFFFFLIFVIFFFFFLYIVIIFTFFSPLETMKF